MSWGYVSKSLLLFCGSLGGVGIGFKDFLMDSFGVSGEECAVFGDFLIYFI